MQFSKRMQNLSESVFTKLDREKDAMLKKGRKIYDFTENNKLAMDEFGLIL